MEPACRTIFLFCSLAIGYLIGFVKLGHSTRGVCGMLSVASISRSNRRVLFANLKNIVFALFIFTPGFTGGLRFFANIGRGCRLRRAPLIVDIVVVVALVLGAVIVLKLDAACSRAAQRSPPRSARHRRPSTGLPAADTARLQVTMLRDEARRVWPRLGERRPRVQSDGRGGFHRRTGEARRGQFQRAPPAA